MQMEKQRWSWPQVATLESRDGSCTLLSRTGFASKNDQLQFAQIVSLASGSFMDHRDHHFDLPACGEAKIFSDCAFTCPHRLFRGGKPDQFS